MLLAHLLDNILQFGTTTCCLILLDGSFDSLFKFIHSGSKVFDGLNLLDVCHLLAKVTRTGVDDEINVIIVILVKLNEVVATAK